MSWDVLLQKFDHGAEATFDLDAARSFLGHTAGFSDVEPGVGEVEGNGFAEIYYGAEPSSDLMIAVRAASPALIQLIYEMAAELRMVVFIPTERSWSIALLDAGGRPRRLLDGGRLCAVRSGGHEEPELCL